MLSPFTSNDAQITVTAAGGNGPYTYESKEASSTYTTMASNVFTTSAAGSYTFRVTDASGMLCYYNHTIAVTTPANPDITGLRKTGY
jgi:hypothetical protein